MSVIFIPAFFALFLLLSTSLIVYYHWFYQYWKRRKIPCLQTHFSNSEEHLGIKFKHAYDIMKKNKWKHAGIYLQLSPIYLVQDLEYIRAIMTKDFRNFPHRGLYYNEKKDPLSAHIFNTSGSKWRNMRSKLNPIFTPGKLKTLFPFLLTAEGNLRKKMLEKKGPVEIKKISDAFINDVIETCIFGTDSNAVSEIFRERIFKRSHSRRLKGFVVENFPRLGRFLNITLIPKDASDCFLKMVEDRVKSKSPGFDFIEALRNGTDLAVEEIAAQCFIFFIAGMSTSPSAVSFALYELARNPEIQERVRTEIGAVLGCHQNRITYDSVQEMKYLDQVFNESLRKYPPAAYLNRKCVEDYRVPGSNVVIEKGTTVVIPVLGIHHDEEFYPDPEKFNPERFNEENRSSRKTYAFIPFGEGPRTCIGMRFGLLQSKVALISLLRDYEFTVGEKTLEPLRMKPGPLVLTPEGGIWLNLRKI